MLILILEPKSLECSSICPAEPSWEGYNKNKHAVISNNDGIEIYHLYIVIVLIHCKIIVFLTLLWLFNWSIDYIYVPYAFIIYSSDKL